MRTTAAYLSVEARDAMVEAGMARASTRVLAGSRSCSAALQGGSLKTRHD